MFGLNFVKHFYHNLLEVRDQDCRNVKQSNFRTYPFNQIPLVKQWLCTPKNSSQSVFRIMVIFFKLKKKLSRGPVSILLFLLFFLGKGVEIGFVIFNSSNCSFKDSFCNSLISFLIQSLNHNHLQFLIFCNNYYQKLPSSMFSPPVSYLNIFTKQDELSYVASLCF